MLFAHIVKPFGEVPYETVHNLRPEDKGKIIVASGYSTGDRLKALKVGEDGRVLCQDGAGTFWAPQGTVCIGADASEHILSDGTAVKFIDEEDGGLTAEIYPPDDSLDCPSRLRIM